MSDTEKFPLLDPEMQEAAVKVKTKKLNKKVECKATEMVEWGA